MAVRRALILLLILMAPSPAALAERPGGLTDRDLRILQSLSLAELGPVPPSPSNRVADSQRAVALGKDLFFDTSLSLDGSLSCASCHQPDKAYTDGRLPRLALLGRSPGLALVPGADTVRGAQ